MTSKQQSGSGSSSGKPKPPLPEEDPTLWATSSSVKPEPPAVLAPEAPAAKEAPPVYSSGGAPSVPIEASRSTNRNCWVIAIALIVLGLVVLGCLFLIFFFSL